MKEKPFLSPWEISGNLEAPFLYQKEDVIHRVSIPSSKGYIHSTRRRSVIEQKVGPFTHENGTHSFMKMGPIHSSKRGPIRSSKGGSEPTLNTENPFDYSQTKSSPDEQFC